MEVSLHHCLNLESYQPLSLEGCQSLHEYCPSSLSSISELFSVLHVTPVNFCSCLLDWKYDVRILTYQGHVYIPMNSTLCHSVISLLDISIFIFRCLHQHRLHRTIPYLSLLSGLTEYPTGYEPHLSSITKFPLTQLKLVKWMTMRGTNNLNLMVGTGQSTTKSLRKLPADFT